MWNPLSRLVEPALATPDAIIQRMHKIAGGGNVREAISFGVRQNTPLGSHVVSDAIIRLRNPAFENGTQPKNWPRTYPAMASARDGIPEIEAHDLNGSTLGSAISNHGSLIIRGLVPEAFASEMRERIDHTMATAENLRANGREWETGSPWYSRNPVTREHDVLHVRNVTENDGGSLLAADSPHTFEKIIAQYERVGVFRTVTEYLGERPALSLGKTVLRRVPATSTTDWHQDGAFLGGDIRVVNLWVALTDCGLDAPGLDVVAKRFPEVVETGTQGALFNWSVGPDLVESMKPATKIESPVFRAGDAIMFDQLCLHRTGVRPGMTKTRYAIESWMFAPSAFPMKQFPLFV